MKSYGDIRFTKDRDGDICIREHSTFPARLLGWIHAPGDDGVKCHVAYLMGTIIDCVPNDVARRFPPTPAGLEAAEKWARATILGGEEKP